MLAAGCWVCAVGEYRWRRICYTLNTVAHSHLNGLGRLAQVGKASGRRFNFERKLNKKCKQRQNNEAIFRHAYLLDSSLLSIVFASRCRSANILFFSFFVYLSLATYQLPDMEKEKQKWKQAAIAFPVASRPTKTKTSREKNADPEAWCNYVRPHSTLISGHISENERGEHGNALP